MPDRADRQSPIDPATPAGPGHAAGADDPAFLARIDRYLSGEELTADDVAALERELIADPTKRRAFALICLGESYAHEELATAGTALDESWETDDEPAGIDASQKSLHRAMVLPALHELAGLGSLQDDDDEALQPAPSVPPRRPAIGSSRRRLFWITGAAAAAVVLAVIGIGLRMIGGQRGDLVRDPAATQGTATQPIAVVSAPAPCATIADLLDAKWDADALLVADARVVPGSSITLTSGLLTLRMDDGTRVVLEAPCRFALTSASALLLEYGNAVVKMPDGQSGFVVRTSGATVTDLGTEFGVACARGEANSADVHVFQGRVRIAAAAAAPAAAGPSTNPDRKAVIEVAAGDSARASAGTVSVTAGGVNPQLFVRDLERGVTLPPLSISDLLSGGDGRTRLVGGVIDQATGAAGRIPAFPHGIPGATDGKYHRVPALPVVDGCFIPAKGAPKTQIDSAGRTFAFRGAAGHTTTRICVGGTIPPLPNGSTVVSTLGGVDYSAADHSFVFLHPDTGLTLDLAAIRRIHPTIRLTKFRATSGQSLPNRTNRASLIVIVDGVERFARRSFSNADGAFAVDVPLADNDRLLTIVTTGDDSPAADQVLLADPFIDHTPR